MKIIPKPQPGEYAPYAIMYIKLLPDDGLVLKHLQENGEATKRFLLSVPQEKLNYRYAPGKWTIKDILLHIVDDERIFAYRALRFARGDATALPGVNQDPYAAAGRANDRQLEDLLEEFLAVRQASVSLFQYLPEDSFVRGGTANNHNVTVRALLYQIAGHELHHINIIKERYLSQGSAKAYLRI